MLQAGDQLGRYRITELIGSGGMGEVYLAEDTELRRRVAVKLFGGELSASGGVRDQLLHEARAASSLAHPNVCTIFEVGADEGRPFIAMEYVEGRTLDALIATRDLTVERVVRYGAQIADAIAHAHAHGVIHRDLKSANVVITADGRAKVLDFGLASTTSDGPEGATEDLTSAEAGRVSGTLPYMAPEVLRGQAADARSDIWALGVVLYEAVAGQRPFKGETAFEVSTAIMKESVELPAGAPPGLKVIVQRCLQKSPGERYQSAAEVRAALEMLQSGSGAVDVVPGDAAETGDEAGSRRRWMVATAAGVALLVVAVLAWYLLGTAGTAEGDRTSAAAGAAVGASGRPTLAVLPFRNHTASLEAAWLATGVPSMLLTSLAQTEGLDVVAQTRVREIAQQLGEASLQELDAASLAEFARRSGAGAVIAGDIYHSGADYRIDVQVEDVDTGRLLSAHSATGTSVFAVVDDVAAQILSGLSPEAEPTAGSIADITSGSLEAWRFYDEGLEARRNVRYTDAVAAFQEAIRLDPEFAMAYFQLARLRSFLPEPSAAEDYDRRVLANLDRIPDRERLYVRAIYALERDEDPERAAQMLEDLLQTYPDHEEAWRGLARAYSFGLLGTSDRSIDALQRGVRAIPASGVLHNQLGYALLERGRYPEAVRAIERYVELNPDEPNAYDSLAEVYTVSGQPERGLEKYSEILERGMSWINAHAGRAMTLAMLGRYDEALAAIETFQESALEQGQVLNGSGFVKAWLLARVGRYDDALSVVLESAERGARSGVVLFEKSILFNGAIIALEAGDPTTAIDLARRILDGVDAVEDPGARRGMEVTALMFQGIARLHANDIEGARRILERVEARTAAIDETLLAAGFPRSAPDRSGGLDDAALMLRAEIELASGALEEAEATARRLEPELKAFYSMSFLPPTLAINNMSLRDRLARIEAAGGELDAAITIYRDLLSVDMGSKYTSFLDPRYVLKLARLLDRTGQEAAARQEYQRFLELWKDADARFQPLLEEARRRVQELLDRTPSAGAGALEG